MSIKSTVCLGRIETDWDSHLVGTRSGMLFRAQIDSEDVQDFKVNFLMSTAALEKGAELIRQIKEGKDRVWARGNGRIPCAPLYDFTADLRKPRKKRLH